eukprot:TRINITY_DN30381_c0_g1_i1.p1 TRINITY_DN30381_c0_g1~~TRINITY_DN30381_c0_g1_i1.p1  ORF type:complete len:253 (+),score=36.21 TRINITY_DN30381_c0_g1_i1:83-760(+)
MADQVSLETVSMSRSSPEPAATFNVGHVQPSGAIPSGIGETATSSLASMVSVLAGAGHPMTCVAHAAFKIIILFVYILGRWFSALSYVITFIMVTVFSAVDFWTVKNITGRLLVGLRWWNHVREDGTSTWVFESNPDESKVNGTDRTIFWSLIYVWPLLWVVALFVNLISMSLEWVLLNIMMLIFAGSNLAGYWKCSKDAKKRAREWVEQQGIRAVAGAMGFGRS